MAYSILFTKQALKDVKLLSPKMKSKLKSILMVLSENPEMGKKLLADLAGNYSLRLNLKDRVIYSIDHHNKKIFIKRCKTHYGD